MYINLCKPLDFYGEGSLRDENGKCVYHDPNTYEKRIRDILNITAFTLTIFAVHLWPIALCSEKLIQLVEAAVEWYDLHRVKSLRQHTPSRK